ncbi:MAG TPA: phospholipase D-like domain-containing protein [Gemmatimonadaceae bacterium]|nr:phospholipase D-like domain-containing protein [Gemmatimonadaceae bacterium]
MRGDETSEPVAARGRPAARAHEWRARGALILRGVLVAVVLLVALIGFLFITRGTAVQHVRGVGTDGSPVAPAEAQFPLSVAVLTGTVLTEGNRVEIALDGDGTFPRLWDDLRAARRSITIQNYYGKAGQVADTLRRILAERAAAGVRVFVLYDAFGTQAISAADRAAFRAAGIIAVPFRPLRLSTLWVIQNRSHVRGVVIDGRVGWTGGFGIDDKWLGDGHTAGGWRDTNVRFEGPAVLALQAAFAAAWTEATGEMVSGRASKVVPYGEGDVTAGTLNAAPTLGSTVAERFLALSIAGARKTLYITNSYFAPDEHFVRLLTEAARRGVDVRLLVGGPRTDVRLAWRAGRARYDALLAAGVRVYEWQPTTLHAKTLVVDGLWSSIGTMNFDNRSLVLNDEVALLVLDTAIGARMNAIFLNDLQHATEITAERFAMRSLAARLIEQGANLLTRVL